MVRKTVTALAALAGLLLLLAGAYFASDMRAPKSAAEARVAIPSFQKVGLDFEHRFAGTDASLPFLGSALLDLDGDGLEEIFLGGGRDQPDGLYRFEGGSFVEVAEPHNVVKDLPDATYGAAALDVDRDGRTDLFTTRDSGITLYLNRPEGFERKLIEPAPDRSVGVSLALGDFDTDGRVDLFVAAYLRSEEVRGLTLFNDSTYGATSRLLRNRGDNTFEDVTPSAGLDYLHNTFQGAWIDLDDDLDPDLVVAHDTGEVRTYENLGDSTFAKIDNPTTGSFGYPMGIAIGDYDRDGRPDLFFSNTGTTIPRRIARGDLGDDQRLLTAWLLFRNEAAPAGAGFRFVERAQESSIADYEFGWGAVFVDFNLDGLLDLAVSESFVGYLPHRLFPLPGRFLLQNPDHTFAPSRRSAGVTNPRFGITPLVSDFNGDGRPDLVHVNLAGRSQAFISRPGPEHWLQVALPANATWLGARLTVEISDTVERSEWWSPSEGLSGSQSRIVTFGLGSVSAIRNLRIRLADGRTAVVPTPPVDARVELSEQIFRGATRFAPRGGI